MTQDEIIEMARKIAIQASKAGPYQTWTHEYAMSLIMQLVEASVAKEIERIIETNKPEIEKCNAYIKELEEAVLAEREACAKLAEEYGTWGGSNFNEWFDKLASEIRSKK
jgi:hypothetical protein